MTGNKKEVTSHRDEEESKTLEEDIHLGDKENCEQESFLENLLGSGARIRNLGLSSAF